MVVELAIAGQAEFIVTHNIRDFAGAARFGVGVLTPGRISAKIGDKNMTAINVKLPDSNRKKAGELAAKDGVSF